MKRIPQFFTEPHSLSGMSPDTPILLALSGGADSVTLLQLLCLYRDKYGCQIYAAHLNHGIRTKEYGDEAARDEEFCKSLCQKLGVELFVRHADVPSLASQSGKSIEEQARDERYAFFSEIMNSHGIKILATAHNADDNLETLIFNLCRGCGIDGLTGIPRFRDISGVKGGILIRPLLSAQKKQILELCQNEAFEYVTDSTNLEDDCTRNKIRHTIIPELENLFGNPQKSAERLSRAAAEDSEYINAQADAIICSQSKIEKTQASIPLNTLVKAHPSVQKRIISRLYAKIASKKPENIHVSDILSLCKKAAPHSSISLPLGFCGKIENAELIICKSKLQSESEPYDTELCDGMNNVSSQFAVYLSRDGQAAECDALKVYKLYTSATIKSDKILSLSARSRREGDTVRDGGMTKKVKVLMSDKKIPLDMRAALPLICSDDEIIYIPNCAVADAFKRAGAHEIKIDIYIKDISKG